MDKDYYNLVNKINDEYLKKNKFKLFLAKINPILPFLDFVISVLALFIAIIALFKWYLNN